MESQIGVFGKRNEEEKIKLKFFILV